jgi:hypothetical protein
MSLVWTEGFDTQANAADLSSFTNTSGFSSFVAGRYSGRAAVLAPNGGSFVRNVTPVTFCTFGFAYRINDPASQLAIAPLAQSGLPNITVVLDVAGTVSVWSGDTATGTLLQTSPAEGIEPYVWAYCGIQILADQGGGAVIVNIDGIPAVSLTGVNTSADTSNIVSAISWQYLSSETGSDAYLDDMYFCDRTGIAAYTGFLGICRIATAFPNGAGSHTELTPLDPTKTNWQMVSKHSMPGDASGTFGDGEDTFTCAPALGTDVVLAVEPVVVARSATHVGAVQTILQSGTTEAIGSPQLLNTAYGTYSTIYTTDPATNASWVNTAVEDVQFGYKVG